jgi:hypothetical protein
MVLIPGSTPIKANPKIVSLAVDRYKYNVLQVPGSSTEHSRTVRSLLYHLQQMPFAYDTLNLVLHSARTCTPVLRMDMM